MTFNGLTRLVKQARQSAKEKATEWAERLGKPTSTGIATGAGLGAILAAIGALKRDGEKNPSALTNPLLLGSLGAAGGYLAGNAFEKAPAKRDSREMSLLSMLGLTGGAATLGSRLSKLDADIEADRIGKEFDKMVDKGVNSGKIVRRLSPEGHIELDLSGTSTRGKKRRKVKFNTLTPQEAEEFSTTRKAYSDALRRAGRAEEAVRKGVYTLPGRGTPKLTSSAKEFWDISNKSPKNILKALNPFQFMQEGRAATATTPAVPGVTAGGSIKKFFGRIGKAMTHKSTALTARLAALAMLAGGGKAIYDYARD